MKSKLPLVIVGLCGLVAASAWSAEDSQKSAPPASTSTKKVEPASSSSSATSADQESPTAKEESPESESVMAQKLPPELATSKAIEEANKEHIRSPSDRYRMETPPPPLRAEKKPPSPAPGMVWVPGHWVPVKGEWQWTPGEWGIPATPISVWIDAKYDPKSRQWSAGYWQPDRPAPHRTESPDRDTTPIPKFF